MHQLGASSEGRASEWSPRNVKQDVFRARHGSRSTRTMGKERPLGGGREIPDVAWRFRGHGWGAGAPFARVYGRDHARMLARALEYQWREDPNDDPFAIK